MAKSVGPTIIPCALTALLMCTAGCADPPKTVTKEEVASQIKQKKWDVEGHRPESVSCPDNLKPAVGAKVVCQMTIDGRAYDVAVTVTKIDGNSAVLDIVEQEPR